MNKLKKDIEKVISDLSNVKVKIIFKIENNNQLLQMIENLRLAGYCENHHGWVANKGMAKKAFDQQSSNFIELSADLRTVTYSTQTLFKEAVKKGNKTALNTADYLEKQVKRKLAF